jgi:hypothetical protein
MRPETLHALTSVTAQIKLIPRKITKRIVMVFHFGRGISNP